MVSLPKTHYSDNLVEKTTYLPDIWRFPWQDINTSLGYTSLYQIKSLQIYTLEDAEKFFASCGFNLQDPYQVQAIEKIYGESLHFIRHTLLNAEERNILPLPIEFVELRDIRILLLLASERIPRRRYKRQWACAILKVMMAVANLEFSDRLKTLDQAREQILGNIRKHIIEENGQLYLSSDSGSVRLVSIDWKEAKTRQSILLKLLHKSDSVMDEVFDFLGVRFVVEKVENIPHALRYLVEAGVLVPHQVIASRSRNSLLNIKRNQQMMDFLSDLLSTETIQLSEFSEYCRRLNWTLPPWEANKGKSNIASDAAYRSLQFTVRHLVRIPNPAFLSIESLSKRLRKIRGLSGEDRTSENIVPREITLYYPIEIQMMDIESYDIAKIGAASHEKYKSTQLQVVREKVLGRMLKLRDINLAILKD